MDNKFNYEGEECMKVFVSWSGELSKKIAEELKKMDSVYHSIGRYILFARGH